MAIKSIAVPFGQETIHEQMTSAELDALQTAQFNSNKEFKKQNVYDKRDEKNAANMMVNSKTYIMDADAQQQFLKAITNLNLGVLSTPVTWTLADNTTTDLDTTELTNIMTEAQNREKANYDNARTLIDKVEAAASQSDLDAIDINSGWS